MALRIMSPFDPKIDVDFFFLHSNPPMGSLRLVHLAGLALFHLVDDRRARVSRARARKGMEQVIGNIRFFTIGMCCLAAAI